MIDHRTKKSYNNYNKWYLIKTDGDAYAYQLQTLVGVARTARNDKKELRKISGISTVSLAKLGKDENLTTDVLLKICEALNCNINEIIETGPIPSKNEKEFDME